MTNYVTHVRRLDNKITHLLLEPSVIKTVEECIHDIDDFGVEYRTAPNAVHDERIHTAEDGNGTKYLRTNQNETIFDNLGELPEFELPIGYV